MKALDQTASAARFLLGGIGTGNISLDQNGRLTDFEIFNTPNKGFRSPYTFFAVNTISAGGQTCTRALESQLQPPYHNSHGFHAWETAGLPRFRHSTMNSKYPFVNFTFSDASMPVEAQLEAFTPFIPLNADDSSLPGAVLRYTIKNISDEDQSVSVAGCLSNLCDYTKLNIWTKPMFDGVGRNQYVEQPSTKGIHFTSTTKTPEQLRYLDMAFTTTFDKEVTYKEYWNEGAWWDGLQDFWNDFTADGKLDNDHTLSGKGNAVHESDIKVASLCLNQTLAPGEEGVFEFLLTWYHPNRLRSWWQHPEEFNKDRPLIKNYYAKFGPSLQTAEYLAANLPRLESQSRSFANGLYASSLPEEMLDAVACNITVLRSNTCFRVEDGSFFGFEGQFDTDGCCAGSCTHVWNYAQTVAFLFPELERSMRRTEFLQETQEDGAMRFRAHTYLLDPEFDMHPAADGQMGCILRLYRDWMLSGDDAYLKELWPNAKKALEYAFTHWDCDGDGMMESSQHNTYDIEFYGPNSMMSALYFAALRAGEEISRYLGNHQDAEKYAAIQAKGSALLDQETFNGEYYIQKIDDLDQFKYQYGTGCLADQLLGQQLAHINGLGYVLNPEHVKKAVSSIYRYNFRESFNQHCNLQRTYALNDDSGLLICTWPHGGRPEIPFVYCDEVWTGIEYQVATHLIYEGFLAEAQAIVKAARQRQDGKKRSPWNEVECGHHYARSMASYGLLLAMSGFHCNAIKKELHFQPAGQPGNFSCFFCCGDGWGLYHRSKDQTGAFTSRIEVLYGSLSGYHLHTDGQVIPL